MPRSTWAVPPELVEYVRSLNPSRVLEFGGGEGTLDMRSIAPTTTIEEDRKYAAAPFQHADGRWSEAYVVPRDPETDWYDADVLHAVMESEAARKEVPDVVVVDGPSRTGRNGLAKHLDLIPAHATVVLDDFDRLEVMKLGMEIGRQTKRICSYVGEAGDGRKFAAFSPLFDD